MCPHLLERVERFDGVVVRFTDDGFGEEARGLRVLVGVSVPARREGDLASRRGRVTASELVTGTAFFATAFFEPFFFMKATAATMSSSTPPAAAIYMGGISESVVSMLGAEEGAAVSPLPKNESI